jgi:3-hydroxyisobutyrate dehydrogenase
MATVAFLGLGRMGSGMAQRLSEAGHVVRAYSRSVLTRQMNARSGIEMCDSIADACRGSDAVFSMVTDDAASRAVWLSADGALASRLAPNALAIECSTLSRAWVIELAQAACGTSTRR